MRITLVPNVRALLDKRHDVLLNDRSIPLPARHMISVHMSKPWIRGFWFVAIRPTGTESKSYLGFKVGTADGTAWYFPSKKWWIAHAHASHPPDGSGCDVAVHTDFLTSEGSTHEFDYATVSTDGQLKILHRGDFEKECSWWDRKER